MPSQLVALAQGSAFDKRNGIDASGRTGVSRRRHFVSGAFYPIAE
jgi:hypothetical protein